MNRFIALSALTALAVTLAFNPANPARAQEPQPPITKPQAVTPPPTDTLILKYWQPQKFSVLDAQMTLQAAEAAGAPVAPMHTLTADAMQTLSTQAGVELAFEREMSGDAFVLKLPQVMPYDETAQIAKQLMQLKQVEYAEPSGRKFISQVPNDPRYGEQWHYSAPVTNSYGANLPAAWDVTTGTASIVVAALDTGIRFDHPDLSGRTVPGYDFITDVTAANDGGGRDTDAADPGDWCPTGGQPSSSWHGTHVAGTIGANSNNGVGVAGINWNSKILPVRVLGKCGGDDPDIIDGMRWAAGLTVPGVPSNPTPAHVLNMSLGGSGPCLATFQNAINEIIAQDTLVVVAAGNSNTNASADSPGNCANVATVAASDRNGNRASYSNFGAVVELTAPGGSGNTGSANAVLSTMNAGTTTPGASNYQFYNGTSMAAPHVAGVASLMLSVNPSLNPLQLIGLLQSSVTPFPGGSTCTTTLCGAGILNAAGAVIAAQAATGQQFTKIYVPLVMKQQSGGIGGPLVNAGFEDGRGVGWVAQSAYGDPLIYQNDDSFLQGADPHGGNWAAWLGGLNNENATLGQSVTVPSGAPYLVYYQLIASSESSCTFDVARVAVNGTTIGSAIGLCASTHTRPNWLRKSLDLSAYSGQAVTLEFRLTTDSTIESSWLIDDVSFSATP